MKKAIGARIGWLVATVMTSLGAMAAGDTLVRFAPVDPTWTIPLQVTTNAADGVYAPVSVFDASMGLSIGFGVTNPAAASVAMPDVSYAVEREDGTIARAWTNTFGTTLSSAAVRWINGGSCNELRDLPYGNYRLTATIGGSGGAAVFRFAVRNVSDSPDAVFSGAVSSITTTSGNDYARPPFGFKTDASGVGYGSVPTVQFGPFAPMNGIVEYVHGSEKAPLDLVFLVDVTGSMSGTISGLKSNIISFFTALVNGDEDHPPVTDWRAKVVGYRDYFDDGGAYGGLWYEDNDFATDVDSVISQISALTANGGGDGPESLLDASWLLASTSVFRENASRVVLAFTDANYKGTGLTHPYEDDDQTGMADSVYYGTDYQAYLEDVAGEVGCYLKEKGIVLKVFADHESSGSTGFWYSHYSSSYSSVAMDYHLDWLVDETGNENSSFDYVNLNSFTADPSALRDLAAAVSDSVKEAEVIEPKFSATVKGPGILAYEWRNMSTAGSNNVFTFKVSGVTESVAECPASASSDWQTRNYTLGEGDYTCQWFYKKLDYDGDILDCGQLRNVTWLRTGVPVSIELKGSSTVKSGGEESYWATVRFEDGTTTNVIAQATWSVTSGADYASVGEHTGVLAAGGVYDSDKTVTLKVSFTSNGETVSDTKNVTVTHGKKLDHLVVTGATSVEGGESADYKAVAHYVDGTTEDVTAKAEWSVSPAEYGTMDSDGTLTTAETTDSDRKATVTATYSHDDGEPVTKSGSVEVAIGFSTRLKRPMSLVINGPDMIDAGATCDYTATVTYNDGTSVEKTLEAVWSVTPAGGVATVVKGDTNVKLTAAWTATGTLELRAEYMEGAETIDDGLVAWYKFDGDANDSSGNGCDSKCIDGVAWTFDRKGCAESACNLSGKCWLQRQDQIIPTNSFTLTCWVKPEGWLQTCAETVSGMSMLSDCHPMVVNPGGAWNDTSAGVGLVVATNGIAVIEGADCYYAPTLLWTGNFANTWVHVTVVVDSNSAPSLYVNGMFVRTGLQSHRIKVLGAGEICGTALTDNNWDYHRNFNGALDDLRIYNRALSAAEVKALYGKGDDGLVAWYKFDGNAEDSSGNGNDGVVSGVTVTTDRNDNACGAYHFDGEGSICVPDSMSLSSVTGHVSLSAWVKIDAWQNVSSGDCRAPLMFKQDAGGVMQFGWFMFQKSWVYRADGVANCSAVDKGSGDDCFFDASIPMHEWFHIALSEDDAGMSAYINGKFVGISSESAVHKHMLSDLYIGNNPGGSGGLIGALDDIRIYNRALSAAEVSTLYAGDVGGLAHRWSFNGSLADSVGGATATSLGTVSLDASAATLAGGSHGTSSIALGDVFPTNTEFTLEFWATQITTQYFSHMFHVGDVVGKSIVSAEWSLGTMIAYDELGLPDAIGLSNDGFCTHMAPWTLGTEFHIALTLGKLADGRWKYTMYKQDAVTGETLRKLEYETYSTTPFADLGSSRMYLGYNATESLSDANASYNEVRIWSRALTEDELTANAQLGPDVLPSTTVYTSGVEADSGTDDVTVEGAKTVTVKALPPPAAPTGVTATDGTYKDKVVVSWGVPTSTRPIVAYEVSRAKKGTSAWTVLTSTLTTTSYSDTSVEVGADYTYRVRAANDAGFGAYSGTDIGWRGISLTLAPSKLSSISYAGYATTVNVTANAPWTVSATAGAVTATKSGDTVSISIPANAELANRSGSVTVRASGADHEATATLAFTQAKRPPKLSKLVITSGPDSLEGGKSGDYTAIAYFDDDSSKDVTTESAWAITPDYGTISKGHLTTYETTDVGRRATIKATYKYTTYEPTTLTAEKEIGIDFTMALLKPVSITIEGDDEMYVTESRLYHAIVGWNNSATSDVSVAEGMAWTTPAPYGAVQKDTDAAKLTGYGAGRTVTLTGTYTHGTNSVVGTKDVEVKEIISLPIAVDLEDADVSTSGAFRVIHYNLNFSPKTIAAAEGAIIDSSKWIGSPVTGEYATISFRNADDRDGLPHLGTVSFPGISGGYHEYSYFACLITGKMLIPEAGDWTFACDIDDGFQFDLTGHGATYVFDRDGITSLKTDLKTFHIAEAGIYDIRAIFYDQGGQAVLSMAAAKGTHTTFDTSVFKVIGTADSEITVVPLGKKSDLVLSTGGTSGIGNDWYGQLSRSHDGVDAGQSGKIFGAGESWMSTVVTNAGDVSFWWKTSSESAYDYLKFEVDGEVLAQTSGTADGWRQLQFEIPSGTHTLRWTYVKDDKNDVGSDCGWVDQIVWTPLPTPSPVTGDGTVSASDGTYTDYVEVEWSPFDSRRTVCEYELSRKSDTSGWEVLTSSNILRFVDMSAVPGVDYTYRVRARNEAGWSDYISDDGWRAYSLAVDPQLILAPYAGCETSVVVTANADWEVAVDDGDWTAIAKESESVVRVDVADNESLSARTNYVNFAVGGTSAHATNVDVVVVQAGRPAKYDVGFVKPRVDWRTRLQVSTNTTEAGAYAPISVFTSAEPLDISFGWTNRSEVAVSMPSIRFRLYAPGVEEPVSEWNVEGRAGEVLASGAGAWSGAWPFEPLRVLKPGDYRLEAELAPDMKDINRKGDLDSDNADNTAIFRFAVRDPSLDAEADIFYSPVWTNLELKVGNDFAQAPHVANRSVPAGDAEVVVPAMQFGPYVPMDGLSGIISEKAPLDLVFLVDFTGSMGGCISGLKRNIAAFFESLVSGDEGHPGITDWRAKVIGYQDITCDSVWYWDHAFTTDVSVFNKQVNELYACGGGDWEESLLDAVYRISTETEFRKDATRVIVAFTDAPYKTPMSYGAAAGGNALDAGKAAADNEVILMLVSSYNNAAHFNALVGNCYSTNSTFTYTSNLASFTGDKEALRKLANAVGDTVHPVEVIEPELDVNAAGKGTLTFDWNNDSTAGVSNSFTFVCDGVTNISAAAGSGWQHVELELENGWHAFKWLYGKRGYQGAVTDCGVLANVVWEPYETTLEITPNPMFVDSEGYTEDGDPTTNVTFTVECNSIWKVIGHDDWIHISRGTGDGDGELVVTVDPNPVYESRTGSITVRAGEYGLPTDLILEKTVRVVQRAGEPVPGPDPQILTVGVKPRWPWNDKVDIDFRVVLPEDGTPLKITFRGVNHECDGLDYDIPTLTKAKYCTPKKAEFVTGNEVASSAVYAVCPTSGWYRITWQMGADWYSSYSSVWKTRESFHSPAFAVELSAQRNTGSGSTATLESEQVRVDMREISSPGGVVMTGVEKIGHPDGKVDPVSFDTTTLSNGWNKLDFIEQLPDKYTNDYTRACVVNETEQNKVVLESGIIATDTVWRADRVHLLRDNVFVAKGAKLTIEDSAVVKFCYCSRLYVFKDTTKNIYSAERYNIRVKGAYLVDDASDASYGGDTLYGTKSYKRLSDSEAMKYTAKDQNFDDVVGTALSSGVLKVTIQHRIGFLESGGTIWERWKLRYYTRGEEWGNIPRPSEEGMVFYGWYTSAQETLSPADYWKRSDMINPTDAPLPVSGKCVYQIYPLLHEDGWADSYWEWMDGSEGFVLIDKAEAIYNGTKQKPTVTQVSVRDSVIDSANYEVVYGDGDYISAGHYSIGVDFSVDYTNSPLATFTIEQRPIDGGEILFANPTNGVMYLPGQKKPTVTVHLPAVGDSVIADSVATRDAKISWLDPDDHVWPEVGDYKVVASYEDNPNYTGGAITNVFTISVNPDYVFTEYYTLDEVADQIEVFKSKYGRNPRIIRFSGRTNDVLSLDWKDKIRGNTALNDFVSTNFICWADNTAGDPGIGVRAIADLERDIVSIGGVLSVSQLFDFLREALVAKELPVDASLAELSLVGGNSFEYSGSQHQPTVEVRLGGVLLSSDEYELVYSGDGVAVGTYSVYAVFYGASYCGETESITYSVTPKTLTADDFSLVPASAVYDGTMHKPSVNADGVVCTIDYGTGDFTPAGTYPITVTASGNHTGSVMVDFVVSAQKVDAAVIELDQYQVSITEKKSATNLMPHVQRVYAGSKEYDLDVDYTLDFGSGDYKSLGTYTITATFCGNYAGTATATFVIAEAIPVVEPVPSGEDVDVPPEYGTAGEFAEALNNGTANKLDYLKAPGDVTTTDTYLSYFSATPSGDAAVTFALNTDGTNAVESATEEALADALAAVLSADGTTATLSVGSPLVGFYYSLKQGSDLGAGLSSNPGDRNKLGGRDTISFKLTKPEGAGFYQIIVTPTEYSEK